MNKKEFTQLFAKTKMILDLLEELERLANEILQEPLTTKNQMTMQGIFVEVNKTLSNCLKSGKVIDAWEEKFQLIVDQWYKKNQDFAEEELEEKQITN